MNTPDRDTGHDDAALDSVLDSALDTGPAAGHDPDDLRDELPDDLDHANFVGAYQFPDNSRRRIPGYIYVTLAAVCFVLWLTQRDDSALVNDGFAWAAAALGAMGLLSITSGWRMTIDEKQALVEAQQAIGFPVGHASAQQVWHGARSRPTWRVLCYSAEEPPRQRGLVLVDAVDGRIIQHLAEDNPEQWRPTPAEGS